MWIRFAATRSTAVDGVAARPETWPETEGVRTLSAPACRRGDASIEGRLAKTRRAQAAISYSSVTLTFFSTIYATLTFGYDPSPFILEIVSHAAMAGLDLKPWMTDIGALDAAGAPTDKLRHGSTFVTTMLVTKLFVPVKLPLAAALTPAVSRALRRYGVLGKAR